MLDHLLVENDINLQDSDLITEKINSATQSSYIYFFIYYTIFNLEEKS